MCDNHECNCGNEGCNCDGGCSCHHQEFVESPTHGLNETISVCFYCSGDKEVLPLGLYGNDEKAPERCIMNYEPCAECLAKFSQGCTLVGVSEVPMTEGQLSVTVMEGEELKEFYPSGKWVVLKKEDLMEIFKNPEAIAHFEENPITMVPDDFLNVFLHKVNDGDPVEQEPDEEE